MALTAIKQCNFRLCKFEFLLITSKFCECTSQFHSGLPRNSKENRISSGMENYNLSKYERQLYNLGYYCES
jgi:hypothetical protein